MDFIIQLANKIVLQDVGQYIPAAYSGLINVSIHMFEFIALNNMRLDSYH